MQSNTTFAVTDSCSLPARGVDRRCDLEAYAVERIADPASAVDYWVWQHTMDATEESARLDALGNRRPTPWTSFATDLHLYLPSADLNIATTLIADAAVREVLEHAVGVLADLPARQRGAYLAQIITRSCTDGTVDLFRFRVASLLAAYIKMMPTTAACYGVMELDGDLTLVGWANRHGAFIDLVHSVRPADRVVAADVKVSMDLGLKHWGPRLAGVRYLPLDDLTRAHFYHSNGDDYPFVGRDHLSGH